MSGMHALGEQFAQHVADFRDRFHERGFHDPDTCAGSCDKATHLFARHLDSAGVKGHQQIELDTYDDDDEGPMNHFVNVVKHPTTGEPHVVDWTARQFNEQAGYPHVQPLHAYQRDMGMEPAPQRDVAETTAYSSKYEHLHGPRDDWEKR